MNVETQTPSIEKDKPKSTIKQQVRLMKYLNTNDISTMYEAVDTSPENHEELFEGLMDKYPMGKINKSQIKPFLLEIDPPMSLVKGREELHDSVRGSLYQDFAQNKKEIDIVEYLSRGLFDRAHPVNELDLEIILTDCPTPNDARGKIDEFFGDYTYKHNETSVEEYSVAAEDFIKKFYGKRHEYDACFNKIQEKITDEYQKRGYVQKLTPNMASNREQYNNELSEKNRPGGKLAQIAFKLFKR